MLSQSSLLRPLRLVVALSVAVPVLLLAYTGWSTYEAIDRHTTERIERGLDILQEHTLKALQTVERTMAETNEVLRGLDDDAILAQESRLSARLQQTQRSLPQIQSVWVFDAEGRPLVASTVTPVPRDFTNADREYFEAQRGQGAGIFIGKIVQSKIGAYRFFVVSGRRPDRADGQFAGVVAVSVLPGHFHDFYQRLSQGVADQFGLIRDDGEILARFPAGPAMPDRADAQGPFMRSIAAAPGSGLLTAVSTVDGVERRTGYRKLEAYPIYVTASVETAAIRREFWRAMQRQLLVGVPAMFALVALAIYALRRTQRVQAEIARREIAEAALKQAQRLEAVGQLTGGVAHDFNNLLMVVSGSLERLRTYPVVDHRQQRALDAIDAAARRGSNLTRQLLSFSRRQTHEAVPVQLADRLPQLQDMLRSSLRGNIGIELQLDENLWPTRIDLSEFDLAMLNLAVNARDAMQEGGLVTIAARNVTLSGEGTVDGLSGSFVALQVRDNGHGMPADVVARAFEPFFTTKDVGKGTGLGLSQAYGFARQSDGTATIESEPGRGTVVTLYLPRSHEPVAAPAPRHPQPAPRHAGPRAHVLLVEDNQDVAQISRELLGELGYDVTYATDAASALEILRAGRGIDILFSDIVMPGGTNGVELARTVQREFGGRIAILLATGYSDMAQAASDEGFPILRKPFSMDEMRAALLRVWPRETCQAQA